MQTRLHELELN